ncbi:MULTISPECIES: glycosyltransferase [Bacillus]|uniref:glycosyltransferase n=1 Tax=Bacillus TaxID=1386 RepID=UPI00077AB39A|nr:glycosyltransferase [Bacillus cereus]KXY56466.1 glycosyl transferase family 1 [Bacillus cereus]PED33514.1 glycosyl transferase family 1 [Bacillus cereus]PEE53961.1 glycosyl transferase family 1 [Bacillus cereus]PFL95633.1 glycosyl transferase family 1 [Bacillus cereus]PFV70760.1 glycosyl transferase family 1 [Bacillus cereus]
MKILHISLGLPPYRTGGLTKYSVDLMHSQGQEHQVFLLYPGKFTLSKRTAVKKNKPYGSISVYELINPLPIPLLNGINQPEHFMKEVDHKVYEEFLIELKPEVIHVHTLMGIHKEFFETAKRLNIKIVFTTHDYFGLCPKVNLMDSKGNICNDFNDGKSCIECNVNALSLPTVHVMQSYPYRYLKDSSIVKSLRKIKKNQIKNNNAAPSVKQGVEEIDVDLAKQYIELRNYYLKMFKLVDYFHFNSSIAKEQFEKYFDVSGKVVSISHQDIFDYRQERSITKRENALVKLGYLGPIDTYKGFYSLKDTLESLKEKGYTNWHLGVYGDFLNDPDIYNPEYYTFYGRYNYSQLKDIFNEVDLLIIPSIWKETFGFIGLEAQSYGVPIMVSEYVGFKDLIQDGETGFIYKVNKHDFIDKLSMILDDISLLERVSKNLLELDFPHLMEQHTKEIISLYQEVRAGVEN